jgi:hypothetical protein
MDSEDAEIARSDHKHGWHVISVSDRPPTFTYTCGLMTTLAHPELIVFGLDRRSAYDLLAPMVEELRKGRSYSEPIVHREVPGMDRPFVTRPVHPSQHEIYLGYAMGHCRYRGKPGSLVALQVFWPDSYGAFPIDEGCDIRVRSSQPRLDRITD